MTALHLGAFHGYEMALFLLLIIGPFLGLAAAIVHVRRSDAREEAREAEERVAAHRS